MKAWIYYFVFVISLCAAAQSVPASADSNSPVTLEQYISLAFANNAGLKATYQQFKAASEQIPQAKALADPTAKFGYATENTPQRSTLEVMQELPWFGVIRERTDAATYFSKAVSQKYQAKKLEILNDLKKWFYEYCYLAKSIEITNENVELVKHFEEAARSKYAVSTTSTHPDIIKAQIELITLQDTLVTLNAYRQPLVVKLNSIMNRPSSAELPWPQRPEHQQLISINFDEAYSLIIKNNPDLMAMSYSIEAARSNKKLAEKRFYPNLGVGVSVDAGMGKDMGTRVMPMIAINLPLWQDSYKAGERQSQAMLIQAIEEKTQTQNDFAGQLQQILFEYNDSARKIKLYGDRLIPKAKEHLLASDMAYQSGSIDFLALIDAQRELLNYQLLNERVLADNAQKLAELEMLAGTELNNKTAVESADPNLSTK